MTARSSGSLHARVLERHPTALRSVVSKAAMARTSRVVEAVAASDGPDAVLVGGFQYERYWRSASARYGRSVAATLAIARPASAGVQEATDGFVALPSGHPLEAEWFVVALGPTVSVVLVGLDLDEVRSSGPTQASRTFDVVLSTDPRAVRDAFELLGSDDVLAIPEAGRRVIRERTEPPATDGEVRPTLTDRMLLALLEQADAEATRLQARDDRRDRDVAAIGDHARRRLVESVHDGSLQHLLVVHQDLEELEEAEPDEPSPIDLHATRATLEEGIDRLRAELSGTYEQPTTVVLHETLRSLATRAGRRGGFDAEVTVDPTAAGIVDEDVVACVREALVNAAKHSGARRVGVTVSRAPSADTVVVLVRDDGVGVAPEDLRRARENGHLGLSLSRSRIERVGGTWSLTSEPGAGVTIRATLPVGSRA